MLSAQFHRPVPLLRWMLGLGWGLAFLGGGTSPVGDWLGSTRVGVAAEPAAASLERLTADVQYLAADEQEGRGLGTQGLERSADYIRRAFQDAGLDVTADGGDPFQDFSVVIGSELLSPNSLTFVGPDGQQIPLTLDEDFTVGSFGSAATFSAPLVFCGYGITAPDQHYDDFEGVDLTGQVAIILRRTPRQDDPESPFADAHGATSLHAALNTKLRNAIKHGAVAVLFVNDRYSSRAGLDKLVTQQERAEQQVIDAAIAMTGANAASQAPHPHAASSPHGPTVGPHAPAGASPGPHAAPTEDAPEDAAGRGAGPASDPADLATAVRHLQQVRQLIADYDADPLMEFGYNGNRRGNTVPVMHISQASADRLLTAASGRTLAELEETIDRTQAPASMPLTGWKADGQTSLKLVDADVRNVVGVLPAVGPLAEETLVIGAHYDHLGRGGEGSLLPGSQEIHNGADDNASGTAALLELARRLAARPEPLPRRIVFIAFTGEERGLLGSAEYVKQPLFPLERTIAMFNMDMVGRLTDDKLTVFGTGTATQWDDQLEELVQTRGFRLSKKVEGLGPSDHSSFYARQIPVLHFFTGTHSDYHRPSDDTEKLNLEGMARIVELIESLVVETATSPQRPEYVSVQGRASLDPRTGARPYFGSIPDFSTEGGGYALQGVAPGSPADLAGLKGGDVIIRLGSHEITGLDDFDLALRTFSPGELVQVVVRRDGQELTLPVTLATPR
jgi:hypothetical protein